MEIIGVRSFLFIYVIFAAISVYLLWRNAAAPDALKNTGIVVASLLPVLVSIRPYLNPGKEERNFVYVLLYDAKEKKVVSGDLSGWYTARYLSMLPRPDIRDAYMADDFRELIGPKGLDIIESGIIDMLRMRFFLEKWDVIITPISGPGFVLHDIKTGSNEEVTKLSTQELGKIFRHNRIVATHSAPSEPSLSLPPHSKLKVSQAEKSRTIIIDNPYSTVSIAIYVKGGGVLMNEILGVLKLDPENKFRYSAIQFLVTASMVPSRGRVYSPGMVAYKRWYENVSHALAELAQLRHKKG